MVPFVDVDAVLASLEQAVQTAGAGATAADAVRLAWSLRQRDTPRALRLCEQAAALDGALAPAVLARQALVQGEAACWRGRLDAAQQWAVQALDAAQRASDDAAEADAHWLSFCVAVERGDVAQRDVALVAVHAAAARCGDPVRVLIAQAATARWETLRDAHASEARWRAAFPAQEADWPPGTATWIHDFLGGLEFARGDYGAAASRWVRLYEDAMATGQLQRAVVVLANIGIAFCNLRDPQAALTWMERSLALARQVGWPGSLALALMQSAYVLRVLNRLDAAFELLQEARALLAAMPHSRVGVTVLRYLADVQQGRGEPALALEAFTELTQAGQRLQQPSMVAAGMCGQAAAMAELGDPEGALATAQAGLAVCGDGRARGEEVDLLQLMAKLHANHRRADGSPLGPPGEALRLLQLVLKAADESEGNQVLPEVHDAIASEYAKLGQPWEAYDHALKAAAARERTASEAAVHRAIAMQVSHQTERARAEAQHHREIAATLQQTTQTLERLSVIGQEITGLLDEARVFDTLHRHVHGLLDATHFAVYLLDEAGTGLRCTFGVEQGQPLPDRTIALDDPVSIVARCARQREEFVRNAAVAGPNPNQIPGTLATASALFAPLLHGERLLGVMSVQSQREGAYGERERLVARTLCAYGGIALDNARAYQQLEAAQRQLVEASLTDPLTRLHNRRYLVQQIEREVSLTLRRFLRSRDAVAPRFKDTELVFYMIDVDHFKAVNDQYGHAAGDLVLVQVAERLARTARDSDFLVRWGGEEFLLVARASDTAAAAALAERLRATVAGEPFDLGHGQQLRRTCSVGFAGLPFVAASPQRFGWSQVVELADHALYVAKREGRDRWVGVVSGIDDWHADAHLAAALAQPAAAAQAGQLAYLRAGG